MSKINDIYRIKGVVQHYEWGGNSLLPGLLNIQNTENKPYAEYWLGAHEKASSLIISGNQEERLIDFIAENPKEILGHKVNNKYGRLPFLLKLLDVKSMLSIQVHPDKSSAEKGFEEEEKSGKPISAPDRNYKDDNHKPEIMVALSDFWLLHGFISKEKAEKLLTDEKLKPLYPVIEEYVQDIRHAYAKIMNMDDEESDRFLKPLLNHIIPLYKEGKLSKDDPSFWAARAALTYNSGDYTDKGIFSVYLLNLVNVKPGEAIYQGAGTLHAYLEGWNVELMANSDNVLRGGLTNKHIDVPELMKHVVFEEVHPQVIPAPLNEKGEFIYSSPAEDFQVSVIKSSATFTTDSVDILFVYKGNALIKTKNISESLFAGEAVCIPAGIEALIEPGDEGVIFRASVPILN